MKRTIVVIGSNRGIGLELTKRYLANGDSVYAICRKASPELKSTAAQVIEGLDVTSDTYEGELKKALSGLQIDVLVHNSGILRSDRFPEVDLNSLREQFEVNSLGPLKTVLALKDNLKTGAKVGLVSSRVGSIDDNTSGNNYGYRTSKTALNMIGKCLSLDFKDKGVAFALLHPGYVRTEMTAHNGMMDPDESAKGLFQRMEELTLEDTGVFIHASGERLTW